MHSGRSTPRCQFTRRGWRTSGWLEEVWGTLLLVVGLLVVAGIIWNRWVSRPESVINGARTPIGSALEGEKLVSPDSFGFDNYWNFDVGDVRAFTRYFHRAWSVLLSNFNLPLNLTLIFDPHIIILIFNICCRSKAGMNYSHI